MIGNELIKGLKLVLLAYMSYSPRNSEEVKRGGGGMAVRTLELYNSTSLSFSKKLAIFKHYFQCVMIHIL